MLMLNGKLFFYYLKQKSFKIALLQETHFTVKVEKLREKESGTGNKIK